MNGGRGKGSGEAESQQGSFHQWFHQQQE